MTQRKRKAPEKKPARKAPGLVSRGASALMGSIVRRPARAGGIAAFIVVFGFVAANALWYQPGRHPSPFFRTRDTEDFTAMAGLRRSPMIEADPATTTTYRIERETAPANGALPAEQPAPQDGIAALIGRQDDPALVRAVQQELANRKLYQGAVDGVSGRGTSAAISAYQRQAGFAETGLATPELLGSLKGSPKGEGEAAPHRATAASEPAAVPMQRPTGDLLSSAEDPVAAAIRDSEKRRPVAPMIPPASVPNAPVPNKPASTKPVANAAPAASGQSASAGQSSAGSQSASLRAGTPQAQPVKLSMQPSAAAAALTEDAKLIMAIQRGLANIAYADVSVDGVAGDQTRAAIRHFERHYRLPETGQPNAQVLKKLKDIGAL